MSALIDAAVAEVRDSNTRLGECQTNVQNLQIQLNDASDQLNLAQQRFNSARMALADVAIQTTD